jgi:hypothetical protein
MPIYPAQYAPGNQYDPTLLSKGIENLAGGIAQGYQQHTQDLQKDAYNDYVVQEAIRNGQVRPEQFGLKSGQGPITPEQMFAAYKAKNLNARTGIAAGINASIVNQWQQQKQQAENLMNVAHAVDYLQGGGRGGAAAGTTPGTVGVMTHPITGEKVAFFNRSGNQISLFNEPGQTPQISPDGNYYWDGKSWKQRSAASMLFGPGGMAAPGGVAAPAPTPQGTPPLLQRPSAAPGQSPGNAASLRDQIGQAYASNQITREQALQALSKLKQMQSGATAAPAPVAPQASTNIYDQPVFDENGQPINPTMP